MTELDEVFQECGVPGWDGYDALPVERDAYDRARLLIESLPDNFPSPSIGAEPDGQLTLEWHISTSRSLSISVDPSGLLHFSGIFGAGKICGSLPFFGTVPDELLQLVWML